MSYASNLILVLNVVKIVASFTVNASCEACMYFEVRLQTYTYTCNVPPPSHARTIVGFMHNVDHLVFLKFLFFSESC